MEITTTNLEETKRYAAELVRTIKRNETGATVLALEGDLGAGKTAFTQGVAQALGVTETITSPTFVIEKIYDAAPGKPFRRLIHIDAYRLTSGAELAKLGLSEILADRENLLVIEWPERVSDILPKEIIEVRFTFIDEERRMISYGR